MRDFGLKFGLRVLNDAGEAVESSAAKDLKGNITFTFLAGCAVGALIVSLLADYLGRKRSILIGASLFAVGGFVQAFTPNLEVFYVGRVVSGLGIGLLSMCVPLYISETAPTAIRGRMIAVQQLMVLFIVNTDHYRNFNSCLD